MLNATIAFRRLFTETPTEAQKGFAWWYLKGGETAWGQSLVTKGITLRENRRVCAGMKRKCQQLLETWDTGIYRAWIAGEGPGGTPSEFHEVSFMDCPADRNASLRTSTQLMEFK